MPSWGGEGRGGRGEGGRPLLDVSIHARSKPIAVFMAGPAPYSPYHTIRSLSYVSEARVARAHGESLPADKLWRGFAYSDGHSSPAATAAVCTPPTVAS